MLPLRYSESWIWRDGSSSVLHYKLGSDHWQGSHGSSLFVQGRAEVNDYHLGFRQSGRLSSSLDGMPHAPSTLFHRSWCCASTEKYNGRFCSHISFHCSSKFQHPRERHSLKSQDSQQILKLTPDRVEDRKGLTLLNHHNWLFNHHSFWNLSNRFLT